MAKRIEFTKEQREEIRQAFGKKKRLDGSSATKITALNMRRVGSTNKEISIVTGYHPQYITDLVSLYNKKGLSAIIGNRYKSNNRRMSFEDEATFLEQFREQAEAGLIISVTGILEKFEETTGKPSNTTTIYQLLKRHGWRKVKPRPRHPNSATEEQKDSSKKKLTQFGNKSYWKNMSQTAMPDTKKS